MALRIDRRAWPGTVLLAGVGFAISLLLPSHPVLPFFFTLIILHLFFFRDPRGRVPQGDQPLSPASGTVADIQSLIEETFIKEEAWRIGIFLSVFDAHITAAPVNGCVSYLKYVRGKFVSALNRDCSRVNESNWIGIKNDRGSFLVRQISGAIARKIFCDVDENEIVGRGQKMGIICYGSRVEVFFPKRLFNPSVRMGDKLNVGETILGQWANS